MSLQNHKHHRALSHIRASNIVKYCGNQLLEAPQHRTGYFAHLRMCRIRCPQLEEMSPLAEVHGGAVGVECTLAGRTSERSEDVPWAFPASEPHFAGRAQQVIKFWASLLLSQIAFLNLSVAGSKPSLLMKFSPFNYFSKVVNVSVEPG